MTENEEEVVVFGYQGEVKTQGVYYSQYGIPFDQQESQTPPQTSTPQQEVPPGNEQLNQQQQKQQQQPASAASASASSSTSNYVYGVEPSVSLNIEVPKIKFVANPIETPFVIPGNIINPITFVQVPKYSAQHSSSQHSSAQHSSSKPSSSKPSSGSSSQNSKQNPYECKSDCTKLFEGESCYRCLRPWTFYNKSATDLKKCLNSREDWVTLSKINAKQSVAAQYVCTTFAECTCTTFEKFQTELSKHCVYNCADFTPSYSTESVAIYKNSTYSTCIQLNSTSFHELTKLKAINLHTCKENSNTVKELMKKFSLNQGLRFELELNSQKVLNKRVWAKSFLAYLNVSRMATEVELNRGYADVTGGPLTNKSVDVIVHLFEQGFYYKWEQSLYSNRTGKGDYPKDNIDELLNEGNKLGYSKEVLDKYIPNLIISLDKVNARFVSETNYTKYDSSVTSKKKFSSHGAYSSEIQSQLKRTVFENLPPQFKEATTGSVQFQWSRFEFLNITRKVIDLGNGLGIDLIRGNTTYFIGKKYSQQNFAKLACDVYTYDQLATCVTKIMKIIPGEIVKSIEARKYFGYCGGINFIKNKP